MSEIYPNGITPGAWIDVTAPAFDAQMKTCKKLVHLFNTSLPDSPEQKQALKELLKSEPAKGLTILAPVYFDYGFNTHFSDDVFINHGCYFMDGARISLGRHVFVGPYVGFYTASHPLQIHYRNQGIEKALPITIKDNCWIGANALILQGVILEEGCVVAAGSVVTKSFGPNSLIGGVPARLIRMIDQNEVPAGYDDSPAK